MYQSSIVSQILDLSVFSHRMVTIFSLDDVTGENPEYFRSKTTENTN